MGAFFSKHCKIKRCMVWWEDGWAGGLICFYMSANVCTFPSFLVFFFFFSFFSGDVMFVFLQSIFFRILLTQFFEVCLLKCICSKNKTNKKDKKTQTKLVIFCKSNFLKMQNSLFSTLVYETWFLFNNVKESTSPWTSNLRLRSLLSTGLFRIKQFRFFKGRLVLFQRFMS